MTEKKYRNGFYADHNGSLYKVRFSDYGTATLLTCDENSISLGFTLNDDGYYEKKINENAILNSYIIRTRAIYNGYEFIIEDEKNDMILLFKPMEVPGNICLQLGFQNSEPGVYEKWVKCDEVTNIHEVSTPL